MRRLKEEIARVAPTDARVLITGENGTGKELVARALHRLSARADSPLIEVNCAAIPEELIESELFGHVRGSFTGASEDRRGKFEEADGATLFLDEIGDMSARTQAKVLRALQEGRFTRVGGTRPIASDARVLSATNKNLSDEIGRGHVPRGPVLPARGRADRRSRRCASAPTTSPLLARHFLDAGLARFGGSGKALSAAALDALQAYRWPGNVRELKNLIERLMILSPAAGDRRLGPAGRVPTARTSAVAPDAPLREARDDFERRLHPRGAPAPPRQRHARRGVARDRAIEPVSEAEELRDRGRAGVSLGGGAVGGPHSSSSRRVSRT